MNIIRSVPFFSLFILAYLLYADIADNDKIRQDTK